MSSVTTPTNPGGLPRWIANALDDFRMVGDAIRDGEVVRLSTRETGFQVRALGREGFEALVRQAGWEVEAAVDEPACLAFRLVKG